MSPGKFDGQFTDLGRYEACINIQVARRAIKAVNTQNNETTQITTPKFNGKYARVFSKFTQGKLGPNLLQDKKMYSNGSLGSTSDKHFTSKLYDLFETEWNIDISIQGEDHLTYHKDFGIDFASLNVTNPLLQDFLVVPTIVFLYTQSTNISVTLKGRK